MNSTFVCSSTVPALDYTHSVLAARLLWLATELDFWIVRMTNRNYYINGNFNQQTLNERVCVHLLSNRQD